MPLYEVNMIVCNSYDERLFRYPLYVGMVCCVL
jgi:hypothetical protein